jgi:hypothetical protein
MLKATANVLKVISVERNKDWSPVRDCGLIAGQTGPLTVGRKMNLNLNLKIEQQQ